MAKTATTTHTLKMYRKYGYTVWKTEYWCSFSRKRKDLLGFIDVLAFDENEIIGIQDTSVGNMKARIKKILASPLAWDWLQDESRTIIVLGWEKVGGRWKHKDHEVRLGDFTDGRPEPPTDD